VGRRFAPFPSRQKWSQVVDSLSWNKGNTYICGTRGTRIYAGVYHVCARVWNVYHPEKTCSNVFHVPGPLVSTN
jgi:hypothetical protein